MSLTVTVIMAITAHHDPHITTHYLNMCVPLRVCLN